MNAYLYIILFVLVGEYILDFIVGKLNVKHALPVLPGEFRGFFDSQKYEKAQGYLKDTTGFNLVKGALFTFITVSFILAGGFDLVDRIARGLNANFILTGLLFGGMIMFASQIIEVPFSIYRTFVLEEKFGFNKTNARTFTLDIIKGWALGALIGGVIFSGVIWFFDKAGGAAWLYCWFAVTLFQLFLIFIAPVAIMPLFNKFIPLEDGELNDTIKKYAGSQNFKMKGIFKMDASRRSTKSNAFFTGFGRYRRIVLYDTLIKKHTVDELVSILAHEIGHYRKKHVIKNIILSTVSSGLMFFILSFFINNRPLFDAFRMESVSIYASLVFFGFLFIPINFLLSVFANFLSRKYEYEADAFAVSTYGKPEAMINGLKKLSVDNLANLTPHPLHIFLNYSHPPVLQRIMAIREKQI
ncbi:MAG: M48 family metallopeptidase [Candidatus Omnitrophica bacterium]|nr:M48 family metallopeptidase [Candidatus Omnitrophota bacterium]